MLAHRRDAGRAGLRRVLRTGGSPRPATRRRPSPAPRAGRPQSTIDGATWSLWRLLRRRGASSTDPQRLTTTLAVIAFAVATAMLLVVLGGVGAFVDRVGRTGADTDAESYVVFAWVATGCSSSR